VPSIVSALATIKATTPITTSRFENFPNISQPRKAFGRDSYAGAILRAALSKLRVGLSRPEMAKGTNTVAQDLKKRPQRCEQPRPLGDAGPPPA
jgi:hypothetical protein